MVRKLKKVLVMKFVAILFGLSLLFPAFAQAPDDAGLAPISEAMTAYDAKPNEKTRKAVLEALGEYDGEANAISVNAYLQIMVDDTYAGKARLMLESATATKLHLEPVADILPQQYTEARYVAAVALFNAKQDDEAIIEMAHVQGLSTSAGGNSVTGPDWAYKLRYKSDAWRMAMEAYFQSVGRRLPSDEKIEGILASYGAHMETTNAVAATSETEGDQLPFCKGELVQKPKMRYPSGKAMRGMYGALILNLTFDDDGQVVSPVVLASVPFETFEEKALKTVVKWRYKPNDPNAVGVTCRLNRNKVILPMIFQLG
jgi:TonB family protein